MKIAVVGDFGIDNYTNLSISKPGGIAFNVAYNLTQADKSLSVSLISIIGNDSLSTKLKNIAKSARLNTSHLKIENGKSPTQKIELKNGERKFTGYDPGILTKWKLSKSDIEFICKHDVVYVPLSDGMESIFENIEKLNCKIIKVADFSQDYEFADFDNKENVITKNAKYFSIVFIGGNLKHKALIKKLSQMHKQVLFVLTLGSKGSIAFKEEKEYRQSSFKLKVVDTTGCGDAFQAAFLANYLRGRSILLALKNATKKSATIIGFVGSTTLEGLTN